MVPNPEETSSTSTQNTQYDEIGAKYGSMADLPAVQPERPSVIAALGNIEGARCLDLACGLGRYTHLLLTLGGSSVTGYDISVAMIESAKSTYPPSSFQKMHFDVADCSKSLSPKPPHPFDIIFAGWFLNYAGTEDELVSMFNVIKENLADGGRFVGITTNAHDKDMHLPKIDFYGLDILVLDEKYKDPMTGQELGIKARVIAHVEPPIQFDVYEFRTEVYERCAVRAGLALGWKDVVLPEDERRGTEFWDRWLERPTFNILEATKS